MSSSPTQRLTGAEVLVRLLRAEGVTHAFGIVGGKLAPLMHALSRSPIRYVGVRHESAAAMMAAASFAGTGQIALAFGEMGPGSLNLAAGTGVARGNHLAALLVTSNQHRAAAYPWRGMFMDLDGHAVFAPLTQWNAVVHDVRRLPELVRTALREALGGRPGPVHLDIPQDVLAASFDWPLDELDAAPSRYRAVHGPRPAADAVAAAAALLAQAKRPLIVAGGGVVHAGAQGALLQLAAALGAPVLPTQMAVGTVASDSVHFVGQGGLIGGAAVVEALAEADVVLALGCRFSSWMWDDQGPLVRRRHRVVNVNIDPSALGEPTWHDVALHADARLACEDLLAALRGTPLQAESDWLGRARGRRVHYEGQLVALSQEPGPGPMHPAALAASIGAALPRDAIAVFDGGHTSFWSNDLTPTHAPRTRFHDPGMSQLGFGLPYAIALQLAHPQRCVVNITGDGSFGFTLQELDTARRERLPVITIVHNNAAWGIIRAGQRNGLDFEHGTSLEGSDYAAIARGFGCHGETIERPGELAPALDRAVAAGRPAVIDARVRFAAHPAGPAFGAMNRFGFLGG
jgi:acetolactate synthase-1/2/3 large subunit